MWLAYLQLLLANIIYEPIIKQFPRIKLQIMLNNTIYCSITPTSIFVLFHIEIFGKKRCPVAVLVCFGDPSIPGTGPRLGRDWAGTGPGLGREPHYQKYHIAST